MRGVCCLIATHGQLRPNQSHSFPGGLELKAERAERGRGRGLEGVDGNGVCVCVCTLHQEAGGKDQLGLKLESTSAFPSFSLPIFFSHFIYPQAFQVGPHVCGKGI